MLPICLTPHPGHATYSWHHAIKWSLEQAVTTHLSREPLWGVELALESELGSGEKGMLNRSSCLELSEIISLRHVQKVAYKNLEPWEKNIKNREQYFRRTHPLEAGRGKYLLQIITWMKLLHINLDSLSESKRLLKAIPLAFAFTPVYCQQCDFTVCQAG